MFKYDSAFELEINIYEEESEFQLKDSYSWYVVFSFKTSTYVLLMVSSFSVRSCTCDLSASNSAGSGGGGPLTDSGNTELCEALGDANTCPGVNCGFNVSTNPVCSHHENTKNKLYKLYCTICHI